MVGQSAGQLSDEIIGQSVGQLSDEIVGLGPPGPYLAARGPELVQVGVAPQTQLGPEGLHPSGRLRRRGALPIHLDFAWMTNPISVGTAREPRRRTAARPQVGQLSS